MKKKNQEINLKDLLSIIIPKLWIAVIAALVCGGVMAAYSIFVKDDTYSSETKIMITKIGLNSQSDFQLSESLVKTYGYIIQGDDFCKEIRYDIASNDEYSEYEWSETLTANRIKSYISFKQLDGTNMFQIVVTTHDRILSYAIAASISKNISSYMSELNDKESIMKTIVWEEPELPLAPNSKNTTKNTALGIIVGAVIAVVIIFISHLLDVVVRDSKKLEDTFSLPVLGVIPQHNVEQSDVTEEKKK